MQHGAGISLNDSDAALTNSLPDAGRTGQTRQGPWMRPEVARTRTCQARKRLVQNELQGKRPQAGGISRNGSSSAYADCRKAADVQTFQGSRLKREAYRASLFLACRLPHSAPGAGDLALLCHTKTFFPSAAPPGPFVCWGRCCRAMQRAPYLCDNARPEPRFHRSAAWL
jgi:hypothetical protein